jgi:hypothetical protein
MYCDVFFVWSSSSFVTFSNCEQCLFIMLTCLKQVFLVCLFVHDCFAIFTSSSFLNHAWSFDSCYELSFSTHIFNLPLHVISSSPWHIVMNWDLSRILTMFCVVCNHLSRHPCFPLPLHVLAWIPMHFKSRRPTFPLLDLKCGWERNG